MADGPNAVAPQADTAGAAGLAGVALLVAGTFFMENLDATVITPAIPHMARSFAVRPVDLNSGVSAYMLTLGVFIPVSGWVADRFGARKVFAAAIPVFTLASLLCGLAQTPAGVRAIRIIQGIGGAMMVPVGRLVVLRVTPKAQLIQAIATLTWPALVAPVLGPPLGGLIADHADWRWIFYLNLPLGPVAFVMALVLVPESSGESRQPFDWAGFLLVGGALFCLLHSAELLGRPEIAWSEAAALAAAGLVLLAICVRHLKRAAHPMVDLSSLSVPTFAVTIRGGSLFRMGLSAIPFLFPVMFQIGFGYDAFEAGMMLMAVFAGNLVMKPMTTPVLRRFGFRPVLVVNGLLNAAAIASCAAIAKAMPTAGDLRDPVRGRHDTFNAVHRAQHRRLCRYPANSDVGGQHAVFRRLPARHGSGRGARRDCLADRRGCINAGRVAGASLPDRLFDGGGGCPARRLGQRGSIRQPATMSPVVREKALLPSDDVRRDVDDVSAAAHACKDRQSVAR